MIADHIPAADAPVQQPTPFPGEYAILPYTQFGLVRTFGDAAHDTAAS